MPDHQTVNEDVRSMFKDFHVYVLVALTELFDGR